MSRFRRTEGVEAHHISATRLGGIVLLFFILSSYAVWRSDRFQNLIQGVSQSRLSSALGRPVTFRTVEFRVFPPSLRLANVRIGNDPRLPGETLYAEEISIGGGVSLVGQQLRLGRIRALRPHVALVQFEDGTWNLPPGLTGSAKKGDGGISVKIGSILIQEGLFEFQGRQMHVDGRFEDFAAELIAIANNRYRGTVVSRRATLRVPASEPIVAGISARFRLDPDTGVNLDDLRLEGRFGRLHATGGFEKAGRSIAVLSASGDVSIEEVERIFHAELGFQGQASVRALLEVPRTGGFRIAGRLESARVRADPFTIEDVSATVTATPEALVAQIEKAGYSGGRVTGTFRIANLTGKPQPMTLAVEGHGVSVERFFGDIGLAGTGLSAAANITVGLRWGDAGLTHANGGGSLRLEPGPATSLVKGRFGLPTGGGGPVSIVDGRIGFEGATFQFPQSTLDLTGGIRIGHWQPDFDLRLRSRDLAEADRIFQNFLAAGGSKPEPLGLGGSGEVAGHLSGRWTEPDATVQVSAEEARYGGVLFGSVRGTVEMHGGAFFFRPLHIYDGSATLSLEGTARYRIDPNRPRFDLAVSANAYPLSRILEYLDFHYPAEARVTGSFPISGSPEALSGGGPLRLTDATLWGQKVSQATGRIVFTPGNVAVEDLRASIGSGMVGGRAQLAVRDKTFQARLAGDAIPLDAVDALRQSAKNVTGKLSFQLSGGGSFDRPDLKATASISDAALFGHPIPEGREPRLDVTMVKGVVEASAGVLDRWSVRASGDLFANPARLDVHLDAPDLNAFLLMTPLTPAVGRGGALALNGTLVLPVKAGELPSGKFTVTQARLDFPNRPGVLSTSGAVRVELASGRLTFQQFQVSGEGTNLKAGGVIDIGASPRRLDLAVSGTVDAALLALQFPDIGVTGRIVLDLKGTGTLESPSVGGTARIENGRYRVAALSQIADDIDATLTFQGSRADLVGRANFGGGEVYASGSLRMESVSMKDFRVALQARRVALRYPQDLRLQVDADLVATGNGDRNDIRGEVTLLRGTYSKDFEVTLTDLITRTRPAGFAAQEPWKDRTYLEVRIVSSAALEVRNNLARLTATVDLLARGTVADPSVTGQITLDEGGRVTFRDVRYSIESGTITFASAHGFTPILDIRARAEVKGYDLVVNLVGTWPRIQTSFSSDPPLPDETIFSLLLTGSAPTRTTTATTSESIVTAGASIAAGAAASTITGPTQRLFKLDRFQIDPVFAGGQLSDVRSTVGKQITPNLFVTYSQSLDTSKPPIVQVEWQLSNTVVLRAGRDENGVYLVDVRRRTRY